MIAMRQHCRELMVC